MNHLRYLLTCPVCKKPLKEQPQSFVCKGCTLAYPFVDGVAVMLPEKAKGRNRTASRELDEPKFKQEYAYTRVAEQLERTVQQYGHAEAFCYLNYGYAVCDNKRHSPVTLPANILNRHSIQLTLEVVGDVDIKGADVLEVGSGRGGNLLTMRQYLEPNTLVGMDLCEASVRFCCNTHQYDNMDFCVGDAERLPIATNSVDVVFNLESSHAYPKLNLFWHEVGRVLKPGGYFLYSDILPVEHLHFGLEYLMEIGFAVLRNQDITTNVLQACDEIADGRRAAFGSIAENSEIDFLDFLLATPGTGQYDDMATGAKKYQILTLQKSV